MFVDNRDDARGYFIEAWRKYNSNLPLEPLEKLILDVILDHPEYHYLLDQGAKALQQDFSPEHGTMNPFLHMSMHIAIKEQIQADRPEGVRQLCASLLGNWPDPHDMEHRVMECLGESLWRAQRDNCMPDERAYLESVRALI